MGLSSDAYKENINFYLVQATIIFGLNQKS